MKTFKDLDFTFTPIGIDAKMFFDNGYGISVIRNILSYGHEQNLYEAAIIKGNLNNWDFCYDTSIANDVMGYLTEKDVSLLMEKIQQL